jgi:hypothetical protein
VRGISYGIASPCKCGEQERLFATRSYGAKVCCPCGNEGPFVGGSEYQKEERDAVFAWNREQVA